MRGNEFLEVDENEVDFTLPSTSRTLGTHANLIPLLDNVHGTRTFYGARFINQALPIVGGEEPLVQSLDPLDEQGRSFEELAGSRLGARRSDIRGEVIKVDDTAGQIKIRNLDNGKVQTIDYYKRRPYNRKSAMNQTAVVKTGDLVDPGQLLLRSNFTSDRGRMAMGVNARIGIVPYLGHSIEDAMVISQSLANRLTSDHAYGHNMTFKKGIQGGLSHFRSVFPKTFNQEQLARISDEGVIRVGTKVKKGDPLILATRPRVISSKDGDAGALRGRLGKALRASRQDASVIWDHGDEGVVTDVERTRDGYEVYVQSSSPATVADKIVIRSGSKGVNGLIIPDKEMPRTEDGKPLDMLFSGMGLPSRMNNAMLYEIMLGKVARKTGKPISVASYQSGSTHERVAKLLKEHGLKDKERVYDPKYNRWLDNPITVGEGYVMKLLHRAEDKISQRGQNLYSVDGQPLKGGAEGADAKRFSGLEIGAALSSGAYNLLGEKSQITGQANDEYWRDYRSGYTPRDPGRPFVWDKFQALLNGSGVMARNVKTADGRKLRLGPLTQKDIDSLTPFPVVSSGSIDLNTLEPQEGGLFDPRLTADGGKWGKIELPISYVNPAYEEAARRLLGLTQKEYEAVLAGEMDLPIRT